MHTRTRILVGQSGGPTAAINASLAGVIDTARRQGLDVIGMRYGIEGFLQGRIVDFSERLVDPPDMQLLQRTPASYLGSCRYRLPDAQEDESPYIRLFEQLKKFEIDGVLYIGGNDSMDTINKLASYGETIGSDVRFVGIPKTIDNDLILTDHTPGYGSAAKFIATCVREISRDSDVYDLKSVTFVEIMGRNTGWLTASACLADERDAIAADLILLPERTLDEHALIERIRTILDQKNTVVVAASEGLRRPDGTIISAGFGDNSQLDAFGHESMLSGTGRYLSSLVKSELGVKSRAIELSTIQRCASHIASATDLAEAYALGGAGVQAVNVGATGKMCALVRLEDLPYLCVPDLVDVVDVANREKHIPSDWITDDGMGVTDELRHYVAPLVSDEASPLFVDGIPHLISPLT